MKRNSLLPLYFALSLAPSTFATGAGEIAQEFTMKDYYTQADVRLSDFEGVLVLDFFAWWCGPCRTSSPVLVEEVEKYYGDNGGNANGVQVDVVGVNIESQLKSNTDEFIADAGMHRVADDSASLQAFSQFTIRNAIPLFVVINCVKDSPSHDQFEVLYVSEGFPGSSTIRSQIDNVEAAPSSPDGDGFITGASELGGQWYNHIWFGSFYSKGSDWYYHETLGWIYIRPTDTDSAWMYLGGNAGWGWTSSTAYPFIYQHSATPTWLYYQRGSRAPRYFYNFGSGSWGTD